MTPIYVRFLGNYDYGIWELATAAFGYLGLLDLGTRQGVVVFAAKYSSRGDSTSFGNLKRTSEILLALLGITAAVIWILWAENYFDPVATDSGFGKYSVFALLVCGHFVATFLLFVPQSLLEGTQNFFTKNLAAMTIAIVSATSVYHLIDAQNALLLIASVSLLGTVARYVSFSLLLRRQLPRSQVSAGRFDKGMARRLFGFGGKSLAQGAAVQLEAGLPAVLIAFLLGPASIIYFAIPFALMVHTQTIVRSIAEVFMPKFRAIWTGEPDLAIRDLHEFGSKILICLTLLMISGIVTIGPRFIDRWISSEYGSLNKTLVLILAAYFAVALLNPFAVRFLTAINRHGFLAIARPIKLAVLIPFSILMLREFGNVGLALALLVGEILIFPFVLFVTCKNLGISTTYYLRRYVLPALVPFVTTTFVGIEIARAIEVTSYLEIIVVAAIMTASFLPVAYFLVFSDEQRSLIKSRARGFLPGR